MVEKVEDKVRWKNAKFQFENEFLGSGFHTCWLTFAWCHQLPEFCNNCGLYTGEDLGSYAVKSRN